MLYNKGSLKNVHLEEQKELGACTGQRLQSELRWVPKKYFQVKSHIAE